MAVRALSPPQLPDLDFEAMTAEELISWTHQFFWPRVCLTCSWQKQSSVLVHMVAELGPAHGHGRARHASLLPRVLRHARRARRSLPAEAHPAVDPDDRRAASRRRAEPLGARSRPLLPHPQGRAARRGAAAVRRLDLGHPPRPVAEPRRHAEGAVVGALPGLQDPPARRLGREAGVVVHRRQRDTLQPAARRGVPLDRLHPVHPPDDPGRGGARRSLGRLGQARVRHPRVDEHSKGRHESAHLRARAPRVGDGPRRRLHPLVHRSLRLGQDDDRAPRRPGDGPPRARRRVPGRRHGSHASLEGPRLLEGGS